MCYQLQQLQTVLPQKLITGRVVKKFQTFYASRKFNIICTRIYCYNPAWDTLDQSRSARPKFLGLVFAYPSISLTLSDSVLQLIVQLFRLCLTPCHACYIPNLTFSLIWRLQSYNIKNTHIYAPCGVISCVFMCVSNIVTWSGLQF
jgi:hypothetical protein